MVSFSLTVVFHFFKKKFFLLYLSINIRKNKNDNYYKQRKFNKNNMLTIATIYENP